MKTLERDHKREKVMLRLREEGWTLQEIGDKYEISRERVRQILDRLSKGK